MTVQFVGLWDVMKTYGRGKSWKSTLCHEPFFLDNAKGMDSLQLHLTFNLVIVNSIFGLYFLLLPGLCGLAFLIISIISYFGHAETAAFWQQSAVLASVTSRLAVPFILEMTKSSGINKPQGTLLTLLPSPNLHWSCF